MSEQTRPIALIEDEFTLKTGLNDLLIKEGFKIESLKPSADMLSKLVSINPSIIITDLDNKNPADLFTTVSAIKGEEKLKDSELFVYTESIDVKKEVGLRKLKIVSYFTKSENPQHLVSGIQNHFSWEEMSQEYDPFKEMEEKEESEASSEDLLPLEEDSAPIAVTKPAQPISAKPTQPAAAAQTAQPDNLEKGDEFQEMLNEFHEGIEKKLDGISQGSDPPVAAKPTQPDNYEKSDEFQEMLNEFHEGIEKKLDGTNEGPEAYYNLGISYFEMGLMDQALAQLEKSSKSPEWKLNSLSMIGAIHRNQGQYDKAIGIFKQCYKSTTDAFAKLGFRYEIADTQAAQGKLVEAYKMFATVYKADKGFRDTRDRLLKIKAALESKNKV